MISFAFLQITRNISKYVYIFIISTALVMILSSILFISSSLKKDILTTIENHADLTIQKISSGKVVDIPTEFIDKYLNLDGVTNVNQRVYGRYYYEPKEEYFTIVGIDLFDQQVVKNLKNIVKNIDIDKFQSKNYMIVGSGVQKFLDFYQYKGYYNFRPPDRSIQKVYIYDNFEDETNNLSSDTIIMDISLAKKILGIDQNFATDIILNVPNPDEIETVVTKIRIADFDIRVISKDDIYTHYINFFNLKSSIFIVLYFFAVITFILIITHRYSLVNSTDKKDIAILRSLGWDINKVLLFKIIENLIVFISAFLLGLNLAYIYVFIFDAPILAQLFSGFWNLQQDITFTPNIDLNILVTIFFIYIIPILASVLIPVWRISISEPYEAMR